MTAPVSETTQLDYQHALARNCGIQGAYRNIRCFSGYCGLFFTCQSDSARPTASLSRGAACGDSAGIENGLVFCSLANR